MRFWFRLALALKSTVEELQARMSSREFAQWWAYYQIEPFGQERDNIHAAIIACAVANSQGAKTKIKDFMIRIGQKIKRQTTAEMEAILKMFTQTFNGTKE